MDYHDPIDIIRHPNTHQEYSPEFRDLMENVKDSHRAEDFAWAIEKFLIDWFGGEDLVKPHFWKHHGYRRCAEIGWALWRRDQFDTGMAASKNPNAMKADT